MAYMTRCFDPCGNPSIPMFPYPPGGGGTTPPDPTVPYVFCPTIPSTAVAGIADASVRVTGQNLTASCVVYMDGVAMTTTFVSASELSFIATHSDETIAHTETITVQDGGTTIPATCQFTYTAPPLLQITCPLVPISVICGTTPDLQITVNGQNITPTTVVTMDGNPLPSVYTSPTRILGTVPSSTELLPRTAVIGLRDGAYNSTLTCPFEFTSVVLTPTLTSIDPDTVGVYDDGKTITYTGTNFDATSTVIRGAHGPIPTTFVNATTLTTTTDVAIATTATFEMRVRNGPPGGPFELSDPPIQAVITWNPGLNMLNPATAPAAGGPITIEVLGTNFGAGATVMVNNVPVPTVVRSGGWLDATLTPTGPGTVQVDVRLGHDHPTSPIGPYHDDVRPNPNNTAYPSTAIPLLFVWS